MFCPKCGAEGGQTRFCRSCGTNLTIVSNVLDQGGVRSISIGKKTAINIFQHSSLSNSVDLDGHTAFFTDGDRFLERLDQLFPFAADMA